jgi:hypothetical protein
MKVFSYLILFGVLSGVGSIGHGDTLTNSVQVADDIQKGAAGSQKKIDQMVSETTQLLDEYKQLLLDADYHQRYVDDLKHQLQRQEQEKADLKQQIDSVALTEKRLGPLLFSMVQALEQFVVADLPFHQQQRVESVLLLRERLRNQDLLLVDQFRMVLDAFQIEMAYGNSLESYRDQVEWQDQLRSVELLRIGRLALYFITLDGEQAAYWDLQQRRWQALPDDFNDAIRDAVQVAKNQIAPRWLELPLANPEMAPVLPSVPDKGGES